jgi:hypothetical protein
MRRLSALLIASSAAGAAACGDDTTTPTGPELPTVYAFDSRFIPGQSSVRYDGQVFRHLLLAELKIFTGALSGAIDGGLLTPTQPGDLMGAFDYYFRFDADASRDDIPTLTTSPPPVQSTFGDFGSSAYLQEKVAGNDSSTDHKPFSVDALRGWSDASIAAQGGSISTPEGLLTAFFATIEKLAIDRVNGTIITDGRGQTLPVHVTASGLDLNELVNKFGTCAIAFHQAADDYLDDDVEGKGLKASNLAPSDAAVPYTALEHAWDEGYGYFGGARDYLLYTDDELSAAGGREGWSSGYHDSDGDGAIDLFTEYNFGHSTNAAKRDRGTKAGGETDLTKRAGEAFIKGRAVIANAAGRALTDAEMTALVVERDAALRAWEEAIAATALHYVNGTLKEMKKVGTDDFSHTKLAKAWSELKGFAMCSQFNPHSPMSDADFATLHAKIGDAPVLPAAGEEALEAYRVALREARELIRATYAFPEANLGGADGEDGW